MTAVKVRPTLRSVIGRGHLILALVAVILASVSLTLLGVLALRVYAEHNLHFDRALDQLHRRSRSGVQRQRGGDRSP